MKPKKQSSFPTGGVPDLSQRRKPRELRDVFADAVKKTAGEIQKMIGTYQKEFGTDSLAEPDHYEKFRLIMMQLANAPAAVLGGIFGALMAFSTLHWVFRATVAGKECNVGVFCVRGQAEIDALVEFLNSRADAAQAERAEQVAVSHVHG